MMSSSLQQRGNKLIEEAISSDSTWHIVFTKNMPEVNNFFTTMHHLQFKSSLQVDQPTEIV
jgi:hypothetical protein